MKLPQLILAAVVGLGSGLIAPTPTGPRISDVWSIPNTYRTAPTAIRFYADATGNPDAYRGGSNNVPSSG
jgi:hypothetical protein